MQENVTTEALSAQAALSLIYRKYFPDESIPSIELMTDSQMMWLADLIEQVHDDNKPLIANQKKYRKKRTEKIENHFDRFPVQSNKDCGYVYFIQAESQPQYIKIGWSRDLKERVEKIQVSNSSTIKLIYVVKGYKSKKTESNMHNLFHEIHHRGEWFKFSSSQLANVEELLKGRVYCVNKPFPIRHRKILKPDGYDETYDISQIYTARASTNHID